MTSLHLTNAYHPTSGGVRAVYRSLLATANELERRVRLVVPGPIEDQEEVGRFGRIYYVKAPPAPAFDSRYRLILPHSYLTAVQGGVRAILQAEQPDILEVCDKYSLFYVAGLLRKNWMRGVRRPTLIGVSSERFDDSLGAFLSSGTLARAAARWYVGNIYAPMFDYHVANSEYTAAELRALLAPHRQRVVHVCPPGVDADAFVDEGRRPAARAALRQAVGGDANTVVLLYAGRLSPEKNVPLLVDMLSELIRRAPERDYRLVLAGDGPLRGACERERLRLGGNRLVLLGNVGDRGALLDLLSGADAFVHANPREPFGIAPLEALAAGLPLVAPAAGGVLTYASPATAWLAEPTARAFADVVEQLIERPDDARSRAARGRAAAELFRRPIVNARLFHLYDALHAERLEAAASSYASAVTSQPLSRSSTTSRSNNAIARSTRCQS